MMADLALLLVQEANSANPGATGIFRFFAGLFLIILFFGGALLFTGWISRDD